MSTESCANSRTLTLLVSSITEAAMSASLSPVCSAVVSDDTSCISSWPLVITFHQYAITSPINSCISIDHRLISNEPISKMSRHLASVQDMPFWWTTLKEGV